MKTFTGTGREENHPYKPDGVPMRMWKELIALSKFYPAPAQFYNMAVALGRKYNFSERDMILKGLIDEHHKPKHLTSDDIVNQQSAGSPRPESVGAGSPRPEPPDPVGAGSPRPESWYEPREQIDQRNPEGQTPENKEGK